MPSTHSTIQTRPFALILRAAAVALAVGSMPALAQTSEPESEPQTQPEVFLDWGEDRPQRPVVRPANRSAEDDAAPVEPRRGGRVLPRDLPEPTVSFGQFSEPMQLDTLIDFVGAALDLNIVVKGTPAGEVVFNAPVDVPESKLLDLLDAMLEQFNFTITHEPDTGFYIVQPITDVRPTVGGDRSSVRIIPTPNIKPSQIAGILGTVVSGAGSNAGVVQAVDELGVLIVTAPTRDIERVESMVAELMRIDAEQQYIRLELQHIAAPAALERAIGLVGSSAGGSSGGLAGQLANLNNRRGGEGAGGAVTSTTGQTFSNLADRITVDPQGNALIFRGTGDEIARVRAILAVIDVPNKLQPKEYFAGSAAALIADIATKRGLGEIVQVDSTQQSTGGNNLNQLVRSGQLNQLGSNSQDDGSVGGPVMVVDVTKGRIIYYGTDEQQQQLAELMEELGTEDERVVLRNYVLNHSDAETVADLITGIITGQRQTGDAPLLPTQGGFSNQGVNRANAIIQTLTGGTGDDVSAAFDPEVVVVIPDPDNNQVIVKAPVKQQEELEKLIERLDRRRAQVYIQALIVSVADNEDYTLAFESQFLSGDFGVNTNFGLGSFDTGSGFTDSKTVSTSLGGLTSAIIKSEYIPLIINATQTNTDVRILSAPQLLVNDNEESEIVSIEEQPFSTTNVGQTTDTTTFGGFAEAGTTLRVTPSISDGGFLRLEYYVELSNFTSATGTDGNPPPRNTRRVDGLATIPSDATIVVGGLTVDDIRDTIVKVPFIGDIPLIGELFKRTNKINNSAKLYVFLTPRIMTDPNFNDLKLLTQGPQAQVDVESDAPDLEPEVIRSLPSNNASDAPSLSPASID